MKKKIIIYVFIITILMTGVFFIHYYSNSNKIIRNFEKTFQLTLPRDTNIIFSQNNHGALGDGVSLYIYQIDSSRIHKLLSQSSFTQWRSMPMNPDMYLEIYERIEGMPALEMHMGKTYHIKGYYRIKNIHDIPLKENEFLDYSYNNIVIGIIDIENSLVYYLKLDR